MRLLAVSCSTDIESAGGIVIEGGRLPGLIDELQVAAAGQKHSLNHWSFVHRAGCDFLIFI